MIHHFLDKHINEEKIREINSKRKYTIHSFRLQINFFHIK